jgi:hypothetical protein
VALAGFGQRFGDAVNRPLISKVDTFMFTFGGIIDGRSVHPTLLPSASLKWLAGLSENFGSLLIAEFFHGRLTN